MKVLQTSALATWLRRPENKRWEIEGIHSPATSAQAIKYEKRGGKSSPKEEGLMDTKEDVGPCLNPAGASSGGNPEKLDPRLHGDDELGRTGLFEDILTFVSR